MLQAILNKSWKQPPRKQQLYGHLRPFSKTIQLRRKDTRYTPGETRTNSEVTFFYRPLHMYILNKSWKQHPTRHQLYGHLPPITKTIQVRRTRHAGHCWRSRDELIRDVLLWIPTHGRAKAGRPARTYIQQLCEDTGCCPEDLPRAMNDWEEWREWVRDIRATSAIWWWWWWHMDEPVLADLQELTYNTSVWTQGVVRKRLMIGTGEERESQENTCCQFDLMRMMIDWFS